MTKSTINNQCWYCDGPESNIFTTIKIQLNLTENGWSPHVLINCPIAVTPCEHHGVLNHQQLNTLIKSLFRQTSKKAYHWPFVRGIHWWRWSSLTKASNSESVSMSWCYLANTAFVSRYQSTFLPWRKKHVNFGSTQINFVRSCNGLTPTMGFPVLVLV